MAWRISPHVISGEIDNRTHGIVTGCIFIDGMTGPIRLHLKGNCWRDLAGHRLTFISHEHSPTENTPGKKQTGHTGDMTASHKAKVPTCSEEELIEHFENKTPCPYTWKNSLYLEWHSEQNGRMVIEGTDFEYAIDPVPAWKMTQAEEDEQRATNEQNAIAYLKRFLGGDALEIEPPDTEDEDET